MQCITVRFVSDIYLLPVWKINVIILMFTTFAARWRQVRPCFVRMSILAPLLMRYLQISSYPRLMAMCKAVIPWWSVASISRFFALSSRSTVCMWPNCAAMWRGVQPFDVDVAFGLAPFFSKISMASRALDLQVTSWKRWMEIYFIYYFL